MQTLLQVEELTIGYRSEDQEHQVALEGLRFDIAAGEAVGLLGESGCGKTTLGLALLGLLPPAAGILRGSAIFRGHNLLALREDQLQKIRGAQISMVYQEPGAALNPFIRVGEQVAEVIRAHRSVNRKRTREEADLLLTKVGFAKETCIGAAYPHQLSGGQQQRVAIAQAIACQPALLIADEPTTALDRPAQLEILNLLMNLRERLQLALLLISHDLDVLARAVDRILVMREGRIVEQKPTRLLIEQPAEAYTQELLKRPSTRTRLDPHGFNSSLSSKQIPASPDVCVSNKPDQNQIGSAASDLQQSDSAAREGGALLRAVNLGKCYVQGRWPSVRRHQVDALRGVSLSLRTGSTLALIGASGSGKSTLARCLAALERPDSGEIWFGGKNLARLTDHELIPFRRQIQLIFQDAGSSLNPTFTAVEIVSEPLLTVSPGAKKQSHDRALELMEMVGLRAQWGRRLPHQFSSGQRRRLAIARALTLSPKVLILDEALAGLDRPLQAQLADLLLELQAALSVAYLYISHDLALISQLTDRVVVMHRGQIVEAGTMPQRLANPQSVEAGSLWNAPFELATSQG